jgi:methionine synthase II (cobalamin-independent)
VRSLNPPFPADHVGSLLRPRRLLDARARFHKSEMTKEQLPHAYAALINAVIDHRPKDLTVASLSPQCGFASTVQGNEVTEADQWAKVELVVNTARDVWGGVV